MIKPPPACFVKTRICSIVGGVFHVSANLRLFSRKPCILESVAAMLAILFQECYEWEDDFWIESESVHKRLEMGLYIHLRKCRSKV